MSEGGVIRREGGEGVNKKDGEGSKKSESGV